MSYVIDTLLKNANDLILVIDNFDKDMSVKDLKIWLSKYSDFLDGFDEDISVKQLKIYLMKILS